MKVMHNILKASLEHMGFEDLRLADAQLRDLADQRVQESFRLTILRRVVRNELFNKGVRGTEKSLQLVRLFNAFTS